MITRIKVDSTFKRDWRKYSKSVLLSELALVEWTTDIDNVQNIWDSFESKLISVVDTIVPVIEFKNNRAVTKPPPVIKNKINKQ